MTKKLTCIGPVIELYNYMISVDQTSYREIRQHFGIASNDTVQQYLGYLEYLFDLEVISKPGRGGGTCVRKKSAKIYLKPWIIDEVKNVLANETEKTETRQAMYTILYDCCDEKSNREILQKYSSLMNHLL